MTSPEVKTLIQFLQNNGATVISGHTKFSVTPQILKEINKILNTIKEDLYVSSRTNTDLVNIYRGSNDLLFLYDFVKKTPKLKISYTVSSQEFSVDVSDFQSLKYLELYKFNVKNVKGIQFLRENLEVVVCTRCIDKIGDLLLNFETDSNRSCIWSKLKHAIFSRNNLTSIDQSFIYTPWLQYLDISYNHLKDLNSLHCLSNLTHLNVSYNHLTSVPELSMCNLKVLLLNNNYITDIKGISKMVRLHELDLSENSLTEHTSLLPLADLPSLLSLNVSKNPMSYHPMHRSNTCGYLHEKVSNECFVLDGCLLSNSERECFKYTSKIVPLYRVQPPDNTGKKRVSKRIREAIITDQSSEYEDNEIQPVHHSTPVQPQGKIMEADDSGYLEIKKQIECLRAEHGEEHWLHSKSAYKVQDLMGIAVTKSSVPPTDSYIISHHFNSRSDTDMTKSIINGSLNEREKYLSADEKETTGITNESTENSVSYLTLEEESGEKGDDEEKSDSAIDEDNDSDDELSDKDMEICESDRDYWVVQKFSSNDDCKQDFFLVLTDSELKEVDYKTMKVIKRWYLDSIERYVKISNEPITMKLTFDVPARSDRLRTYIMEYADAQKLITRLEQEFASRSLHKYNQKVFKCMKCDFVFCHEITPRKSNSAFIDKEPEPKCTNCGSNHLVEEDENDALPKKTSVYSTPAITSTPKKNAKVTQSPSLSSIGSAASLDQGYDVNGNDDSQIGYHESDIEVISNPSQSSIEILSVQSKSYDSTITVIERDERSRADTTGIPTVTVNSQLLESSSSGSMTDSICTSYEANQHPIRRSYRISQSTVDDVLPEESSTETSPQQPRIEEQVTEMSLEKGVPYEPSKLELPSLASIVATFAGFGRPATENVDSSNIYEYSYTDFVNIDHRLKFYIWDQIVPSNEDISAFIKVNKIIKCNTSTQPFAGFLILTKKRLYFAKITGEEKEDFSSWLQKYDSVGTEKIKLIQPIVQKQGFSVEVEDRSTPSGGMKYLCLLYDKKRTDNFLSFVKDLGTVHVQKSDDFPELDLNSKLELDGSIRNFTATDLVIEYDKDAVIKRHPLVGLIVTNSGFLIVKVDADWLLPNSPNKPTVVLKENLDNLIGIEETKTAIILQFMNEADNVEKSWKISTVTADANNRIIDAIKEPWEEMYGTRLEISNAAS